jgi:uncharacterized cupin superfamily protein
MTSRSNAKNAEGVYEPFDITEVPWESFSKGTRFGMRYQHLSSFGGGTQVSLSHEELASGKQANPFHFHMLEEEHLMILEGALTLRLGDKRYTMKAGSYVCFPAGQQVGHALINEPAQPCRYLIFGTPNPHEVAVFPDSGRVSVKLLGEGYRRSARMDYWEAENI